MPLQTMHELTSVGEPTLSATAPVTIREAHFNDYDPICSLLKEQHLRCESREEWVDHWLENELYQEWEGRWPIGWVIEAEDKKIVGTISNLPSTYVFRGKVVKAASARAWAVREKYRAYSLTLFFKFISQPGVDLFLSTTTGEKSAAVCSSFNWVRPPVGRWDCSGFWITHYTGLLRAGLRTVIARSTRRQPSPEAILDPPAYRSAAERNHPNQGSFEVSFAERFDDSFDGFWRKLKANKDQVLLNVRTAKALNSLFKHPLSQNRVWIVAASRKGELLGYGIFKRSDQSELALKRMQVIDVQTLEADQLLCSAIIRKAFDRCRSEGIHILENRGCWLEGEGFLGRPAPFHRNLKACSYFYKGAKAQLRTELKDSGCWLPTSLDGDSGL